MRPLMNLTVYKIIFALTLILYYDDFYSALLMQARSRWSKLCPPVRRVYGDKTNEPTTDILIRYYGYINASVNALSFPTVPISGGGGILCKILIKIGISLFKNTDFDEIPLNFLRHEIYTNSLSSLKAGMGMEG